MIKIFIFWLFLFLDKILDEFILFFNHCKIQPICLRPKISIDRLQFSFRYGDVRRPKFARPKPGRAPVSGLQTILRVPEVDQEPQQGRGFIFSLGKLLVSTVVTDINICND